MLQKFRLYFFRRSLLNLLRSGQVRREPKDFRSAATVGILFDGTDEGDRRAVLEYADELVRGGKKVELMGFVNDPKPKEEPPFPHFFPKDLDWFFRPKKDAALAFAEKAFDVLICAHLTDHRPLEYLAAKSNAHLRVGRYREDRTHCYDLMIDGGDGDLKSLVRQMDQYLKIVNRKNAQNA
jgi:hypothetical protein